MAQMIRHMPFNEYLALDRWSWHRLRLYMQSPRAGMQNAGDDDETRAMVVGRAFHNYVLDGEDYFRAMYCVPPINERTGRPYGVDALATVAHAEGRTVLSDPEMRTVNAMAESAREAFGGDLAGCYTEVTVLFEHRGVECKARIDALNPDVFMRYDLKSCGNVDYCLSDARRYAYGGQLAFYRLAVGSLDPCFDASDVCGDLLFTEKQSPHRCARVSVSAETAVVWTEAIDQLLVEIRDGGRYEINRTVPVHIL